MLMPLKNKNKPTASAFSNNAMSDEYETTPSVSLLYFVFDNCFATPAVVIDVRWFDLNFTSARGACFEEAPHNQLQMTTCC